MQLSFEMDSDSQAISVADLDVFEDTIGKSLPQDYRQHMLTYNGGVVEQDYIDHISYINQDKGISYFFPIKYGYYTVEEAHLTLNSNIPDGYISIGLTRGQGKIIISLNDDSTYGNIKEWYPDGTVNDLSPSFTQLLNDQIEVEDF